MVFQHQTSLVIQRRYVGKVPISVARIANRGVAIAVLLLISAQVFGSEWSVAKTAKGAAAFTHQNGAALGVVFVPPVPALVMQFPEPQALDSGREVILLVDGVEQWRGLVHADPNHARMYAGDLRGRIGQVGQALEAGRTATLIYVLGNKDATLNFDLHGSKVALHTAFRYSQALLEKRIEARLESDPTYLMCTLLRTMMWQAVSGRLSGRTAAQTRATLHKSAVSAQQAGKLPDGFVQSLDRVTDRMTAEVYAAPYKVISKPGMADKMGQAAYEGCRQGVQ